MVRGKEISLEDRVAIPSLRKEGYSFGKIAKEVGCSTSGAYKAFKTYEKTGNFPVRKRTGRLQFFSERDERNLKNSARKNCFSILRLLCSSFSAFSEKKATISTVRRILHKYELKSHPRCKKPFVSLINRRYRKKWAKVLKWWTFQEWKDVVFSDEYKFSLNNDSGIFKVWRETSEANNPDYFRPRFTNSVSAMFWGYIGSDGVGRLVLCTQTVSASYYCEIIHNNLTQNTESMLGYSEVHFIFQQDNASCHTARYTKIYLAL